MAKDHHPHKAGHGQTERGLELDMYLAKHFSNLTSVLRSGSSTLYGGFSVSCKADGRWFAVARALNEEEEPVVAFGSASNAYDALVQLNGSIAAGKWKPDGFAREKGLAPSRLHQDVLHKLREDHSP